MCDDEKASPEKKTKGGVNAVSIAARIAGMGLAVASAALMATASQCTIYAAYGVRPRTITYSNYGPFVYARIRFVHLRAKDRIFIRTTR